MTIHISQIITSFKIFHCHCHPQKRVDGKNVTKLTVKDKITRKNCHCHSKTGWQKNVTKEKLVRLIKDFNFFEFIYSKLFYQMLWSLSLSPGKCGYIVQAVLFSHDSRISIFKLGDSYVMQKCHGVIPVPSLINNKSKKKTFLIISLSKSFNRNSLSTHSIKKKTIKTYPKG